MILRGGEKSRGLFCSFENSFNKRGQVAIFIIIALVIVALVIGFFIFKDSIFTSEIPSSIDPIYNTFLTCLEEDVSVGLSVLGSQGGYIDLPEYKAGSEYMPFSSQLDFIGYPVPYWYYITGNNIEVTDIPSLSYMQKELAGFVEGRVRDCMMDKYYDQGFSVSFGEPNAKANIRDNEVVVFLDMIMKINNSESEEAIVIKDHSVTIKSSFGELYKSAREVFEEEQVTLFLENRGLDVIRNYAPVDGVEISCAPKVWQGEEIVVEIKEAIEANIGALRTANSDYKLSKKENKYFVLDLKTDSNVNFLNSKSWSSTYDIYPSDGDILIANPVGTQSGLGILGFCYVPYHFVYDAKYPVLVQVYSGDSLTAESEIFQFATAVVIRGTNPRLPIEGESSSYDIPDVCSYKNTKTSVNVYNVNLDPIEADISYECFGVNCDIGKTYLTSFFSEDFPQCVNGFVIVEAEGYKDERKIYSTVNEGSVDIIMDRLYEKEINLVIDGKAYSKDAIISFVSDDFSKTVLYPEQKKINLSEGQYEISVRAFSESTLSLAETVNEQCVEIPSSGIGGFFGMTKEECYEVKIPAQIVSNALSGGGEQNYYVLESELSESKSVDIYATSLPIPRTLEQLQENYDLFDIKNLEVYFR